MVEAIFGIELAGQPKVTSVSGGVEALLGYTPHDFLSSRVSLADRIHSHDADIAEQLFSIETPEDSGIFNIRLRHADGRIGCVRGSYKKKAAGGGKVNLHLKLQSAKCLWKNPGHQRLSPNFEALLENTDDFIFFKDRNHVFTAASRNMTAALNPLLFGPSLLGLTDYDLFPEEYADIYYRLEKQVFAGLPVASEIHESQTVDGKMVWLDNHKYPINDRNGKIIGLFGVSRDITEHMKAAQALRESEELLREGQKVARIGSYALDIASGVWSASEVLDEIFGINNSYEHTVEGWSALFHPDDRERMTAYFADEVMNKRKDFDMEYRIIRQNDGAERWVHELGKLESDTEGRLVTFRGTIQEITEEKQGREKLNLAAKVFAQASEGIVFTDANGSILDVNDSFTRITGYSGDEVLGKNPRILNSGRQSKAFYADMWHELIEKGSWSGEVWNRAKNGKVYAETLTISALRDASGKTERYLALFSDMTSVKEQEKKLEHIAHYDVLTGLPNKVLLASRLHQTLTHAGRDGGRVAIAWIDLDKFKAVNDRHGRGIGDQVLVAVARRMKLTLRHDDTLAHLGGDEFVAVLPEIADAEGSWRVLTRLLRVASEPVEIGDLTLQVSVSAGVTYFPQTEEADADQFLRQANQAMYQAKLEGRNRYHIFDPALDRSVRDRHESLERIRQALEANEFVLYYQPKVNMSTGVVLGAEALIRWLHPERGLLPPGEFLPVIEGHPIAVEIGKWVIDNALTQMEHWREEGVDIPVSVNIGSDQLQQADFVDLLSSLLAAHPTIPPSMLEMEVLESNAFRDLAMASEVIRACKRLGVSSALDDFGTGYASLTYLRKLPVDVLKIDQTFVRDMLEDPEDMTILEGMLGLATAFRCQTVAEGVETVEHGLMLLRLGCPVAQGYGIARPMQAHDLPAWASAWRPDPRWENVQPFDSGNRPVLYAGVEHRAWIAAIEDFLNGKRQSAPALDINQCRFGVWLRSEALVDGEVLPGHGGLFGFHRIDLLHQQIHALAAEILTLNGDGRKAEAIGRMAELQALRDNFTEKLHNLVQP